MEAFNMNKNKTLIAVLASHDSENKNKELADVFTRLYNEDKKNTKIDATTIY